MHAFTRRIAPALLLGIAALAGSARADGQPPLAVCMAEGNAPLSYRAGKEPRGLDAALAQAVAARMRRPLKVVFFESEYERESTLAQEVNALLSSGVCQLASGYALFAADLGAPARASARTPDYDGGKPRRQRPFVQLGRLTASRAYYASAMSVITADPALRVDRLSDLQGRRVGVVTGTVAGSALLLYGNGVLQKNLVTLSQGEDLLSALESGRFDATLAPLAKFDAYRLAHPGTRIARTPYFHPLRFNLGMVGLEGEPALEAANQTIESALASGDLSRWATSAGATWVPPGSPDVNPPFSMGSLSAD